MTLVQSLRKLSGDSSSHWHCLYLSENVLKRLLYNCLLYVIYLCHLPKVIGHTCTRYEVIEETALTDPRKLNKNVREIGKTGRKWFCASQTWRFSIGQHCQAKSVITDRNQHRQQRIRIVYQSFENSLSRIFNGTLAGRQFKMKYKSDMLE